MVETIMCPFLVFCTFAVFLEGTFGQCMRNGIGYAASGPASNSVIPSVLPSISPYGAPANWGSNCGFGIPGLDFSIVSANKGGTLNVQSSSPIAPSSITIQSDNSIEGTLTAIGRLPFLSAVSLEGSLPTSGAGGVQYRCGEGLAILGEHFGEDILNGEKNSLNNEAGNVLPKYTGINILNERDGIGNNFRSCMESPLRSSSPGKRLAGCSI